MAKRKTAKKSTPAKKAAPKSTAKRASKKAASKPKAAKSDKKTVSRQAASNAAAKSAKPSKKAAAKKSPATKAKASAAARKATEIKAVQTKTPKPKKARVAAVASNDNDNGEIWQPPEIKKTKLKPAELDEFKQLLIEKRREIMGDMQHLENEASQFGNNGGGSSSMPLHMADLGSDTWEQELTLGFIASEGSLLKEIDGALERIEDRTYGVCLATGKPITKTRLRAKPWAKYCIEYARKKELGLV